MQRVIQIALFVSFLWGVVPVIHKFLLHEVHFSVVLVISSVAYITCAMGFAAYNWKELRPRLHYVSATNIAIIVATSAITGFLANLLYLYILKDNESYIVSALIYSSPVFTLLLAYVVLHERMNVLGVVGVLLIVAGVAAIAYNEASGSLRESWQTFAPAKIM